MEELIHQIPAEAAWKVAGWSITAAITLGTMLYKGVWKRINQLAEDQDATRSDLDQLIGAHNATHNQPWTGAERRNRKEASDDE